jgi:hypothetical protein
MTTPFPYYQPNTNDEIRSIGRFLSWKFPSKRIARSRLADMDDIDILITTVDANIDPHNAAVSFTDTPFVVYYNATDFDDAVSARDKFIDAFEMGIDVSDHTLAGHKRRVPLWQWPTVIDNDNPIPDEESVMGWLRIRDMSVRIPEQDEPGYYVVVCEFRSGSYRYTYNDSNQSTLTSSDVTGGVTP